MFKRIYLFRLGEDLYGLPYRGVKELLLSIPWDSAKRLREKIDGVPAIVELQGEKMPLLSLKLRFRQDNTTKGRFAIFQMEDGSTFCLLVDEVMLTNHPETITRETRRDEPWFVGTSGYLGKNVIIIDPNKLLSDEEKLRLQQELEAV